MASHELRFEMGDMREKGGELIGMVARDASSLKYWDAILSSGRRQSCCQIEAPTENFYKNYEENALLVMEFGLPICLFYVSSFIV